MKNVDVVRNFVAGYEKGKTTNLRIEGNKLVNYATTLAERVTDANGNTTFIINATKYSQSTSAIQTYIRNNIPSYLIMKTVNDIHMGAYSLQ